MRKISLSIFLSFIVAIATGSDIIQAHRLTGPITFDGWINDSEWGDVPTLPLRMQVPNLDAAPTELSEVRMAYDDDYIYLSGRLFDEEPDKIVGNTKKRDAVSASTEFFGLIIDSYNDNENSLAFFTTPTELRWDMAISGDGIGRNPGNIDWNSFWDTKVQQDERGWYAEMRIPFSTLAFDDQNGEVVMGIITWRYIARKNEVDMYPLIPAIYGDFSSFRPSLAQDFLFKDIKPQKPFYITPYVLGGYSRINELSDDETEYVTQNDRVNELGIDIKYGLSKSWTLDLSVNTDFAQVEADDQQVNLTRFSLFFPEKRLFFQERAGIFSYTFGGGDQLFYSRQIGINSDGQQSRIYGGARVVGRSGLWDIGMLSMQTATENEISGENMTVLRAKREVLNSNSDMGFLLTNRTDLNGVYNTSFGFDASLNTHGDNFVSMKWAQTASDEIGFNPVDPDNARFFVAMFSRNNRGFGYAGSFTRSGKNFDPGLGFQRRDDFLRLGNRFQYKWFPGKESKIFTHGIVARGSTHWDNDGGRVQSANYGIGYELQTKNAWAFELTYRPNRENLTSSFELSDDVEILAGDYTFANIETAINTPFTNKYFTGLELSYGSFYGGTRTSFTLTPTFNVSPSLEIGGSYEYNLASFDDGGREFEVHLIRLKSLLMFSTKLSISALLQYNSDKKNFLGNIRLRYNPSEGNDLFIVYNDDLNTDRFRESIYLPKSNQRSFQVKYSYTFRM